MNKLSKLQGISKARILLLLRDKLGDDALIELLNARFDHPLTKSDLSKSVVNRQILIDVANDSASVSPQDVEELYEQYRYSGMKTIYMYRYAPSSDDLASKLDNIDTAFQITEEPLASSFQFRELSIRDSEEFEASSQQFGEVVYTYIATVNTTDPETEEITLHDDLRFGFVWLNFSNPWIAISAKDDAIAKKLTEILSEFLSIEIYRMHMPPEAIIEIEPYERIRRVGHEDERGIRKRVAGPISDYPEEIAEVQSRDKTQIRTPSSYTHTLPDNTELVLGYNGEKGIIYFSKNLQTSWLRTFGTERVSEIYEVIEELQTSSPESLVEGATKNVLGRVRRKNKEHITKFVAKIILARKQQLSQVDLGQDILELAKLKQYFRVRFAVSCSECQEMEDLLCPKCEGSSFSIVGDSIECASSKCDFTISDEICCIHGHINSVDSPRELITLYPTQTLYGVIEKIISQTTSMPYNQHEEGFLARGHKLNVFGRPGEQTVYLLDDLPEFHSLRELKLSDSEYQNLIALAKDYHEKCRHMSNENCAQCVQNKIGEHCLLRLFGLYDANYTPRPHHGHEFGDVSLSVTVDGRPNRIMTIILKSGNPNGHPITMQHKGAGREILSQFEQFIKEPSIDILAIGVPQRIEDGYSAHLRYRAHRENKKIAFVGTEELIRIMKLASEMHKIPFADM